MTNVIIQRRCYPSELQQDIEKAISEGFSVQGGLCYAEGLFYVLLIRED